MRRNPPSRPYSIATRRAAYGSVAALMWEILYTVDSEFGVTASTGVNLSP
jgi:hypothetical protein